MAENQSLDDYIKSNPDIVKNVRQKAKLATSARFGTQRSQQWRLGRNGPGHLKRLVRRGPLRPFQRVVSHPREMPRLVHKMYARLLPLRPSVFLRLGWNPVVSLARQRVRQARHHFWMRQNYSRAPLSFPMGWRQYHSVFRRNFHRKPSWHWRSKKFRRPAFACQNDLPEDVNLRNDELIKAERRRIQEEKLKYVQNNYMEGANFSQNDLPEDVNLRNDELIKAERRRIQEEKLKYVQNNYMEGAHFSQPTLPNNSDNYPIPRDEYASNELPERAPSPEGSIISALGRREAMANPFATHPRETRQANPFAQAQRVRSMGSGQDRTEVIPFRANSMGADQGQPMTNAFAQHNNGMGNGQGQPMTNAFAQRNNGMGNGHSMPHPYMADFRPTPASSSMPLNDRFLKGDGYTRPQMHSSMMA